MEEVADEEGDIEVNNPEKIAQGIRTVKVYTGRGCQDDFSK